jgi:hypothetical protein
VVLLAKNKSIYGLTPKKVSDICKNSERHLSKGKRDTLKRLQRWHKQSGKNKKKKGG